MNSPFGRVLLAIRENEFRAEALGYRTVIYRTLANCLGAVVATLARGVMPSGPHMPMSPTPNTTAVCPVEGVVPPPVPVPPPPLGDDGELEHASVTLSNARMMPIRRSRRWDPYGGGITLGPSLVYVVPFRHSFND